MWKSSFMLLKEGLKSTIIRSKPVPIGLTRVVSVDSSYRLCNCLFSSSVAGDSGGIGGGSGVRREVNDGVGIRGKDDVGGGVRRDGGGDGGGGDSISYAEAKKLMRLVNVEALKMKFGTEGKEMIQYSELLQACESIGIAKTVDEAKAFASVLDEAGVVLIFRDKVYLHPDKV